MAYRSTDPYRSPYRAPATRYPVAAGDGGRTIALLNYALYIAAFFTGVTAFIGVALAYMRRGNASPLMRSHMDWQIRIFWHCILAAIVVFVLHWVIVGIGVVTFGIGLVFLVIPWGIGAWWLVWTIWAIIKGLQRLGLNQPIR